MKLPRNVNIKDLIKNSGYTNITFYKIIPKMDKILNSKISSYIILVICTKVYDKCLNNHLIGNEKLKILNKGIKFIETYL